MRLYWKIFLSFWLAMTLMVVVGASVNHSLERKRLHFPANPISILHDTFQKFETQPIDVFLSDWRKHEKQSGIELYIADLQNQKIYGDSDHFPSLQLLQQIESPLPQRFVRNRFMWIGRTLDNSVEQYKVLVKLPHLRKRWQRHFLHNIWLRISIGLVISAVICFLLARYITKPIQQLRFASAQIARGDFTARTGIQRKGNKDEIGLLANDFDYMTERLQNTIFAQQRLIKDISHELRSPIARLQVALELARQRLQLADSPELDRIEQEAKLLNQLIEQILRLPQLETESITLDDVIDLGSLLEQICNDANYEAQKLDKSVIFQAAAEESLIYSHGDLLHHAVENIVRNGLRHTPVDTAVYISLETQGEEYLIRISDSGPGVPETELSKIFDAFYRVSKARDRDSGGFGLGLSIAKRAIQLHQGSLQARNTSPGLLVEIRLPRTNI